MKELQHQTGSQRRHHGRNAEGDDEERIGEANRNPARQTGGDPSHQPGVPALHLSGREIGGESDVGGNREVDVACTARHDNHLPEADDGEEDGVVQGGGDDRAPARPGRMRQDHQPDQEGPRGGIEPGLRQQPAGLDPLHVCLRLQETTRSARITSNIAP